MREKIVTITRKLSRFSGMQCHHCYNLTLDLVWFAEQKERTEEKRNALVIKALGRDSGRAGK